MKIRKLNSARGWIWVKQGYQLIMCNPLMSVTLALFTALVLLITLGIPPFGPLLATLMMPIVLVGYMRVCRALEEDERVETSLLFAGFQKHTARLFALGGLLLLSLFASSIVILVLGGEELRTLIESLQPANDPQKMMEAMQTAGPNVASSLTVGAIMMGVLVLAFQYAPMLVFFNEVSIFSALRASLIGLASNMIPSTVFSCIMLPIALGLAALPYGIGLIVFFPLALTSLYVSYRNIFPLPDEIAEETPVSQ